MRSHSLPPYSRLGVSLLAVGAIAGGCTGTSDRPYAHEAMRHPTAAEQLFGAPSGPPGEPPLGKPIPDTTSSIATVAPAPKMAAPGPLTVPQPVARMAPSDASFAQQQFAGSAVEIELGRIAYVRAQSSEVRAFARQMLIDHRDMAVKLDNFALERGYLVDWTIAPDRSATIARLRSLDDASFDRAYMDEMVKAHEQALARLEIQAGSGRETAVIAADALPVVQHHLAMAREIHAQL